MQRIVATANSNSAALFLVASPPPCFGILPGWQTAKTRRRIGPRNSALAPGLQLSAIPAMATSVEVCKKGESTLLLRLLLWLKAASRYAQAGLKPLFASFLSANHPRLAGSATGILLIISAAFARFVVCTPRPPQPPRGFASACWMRNPKDVGCPC